ncbi:hypothetical protein [Clostridium botulinum]|uniref:hypothetical protein n=1 Tax=Clostridium botulinum TaxID=1491 RepID=UPI003EF4CE79
MLAICNEGCKEKFELESLKESNRENDVVEIYFICPYCGKKYICCFTNRMIRLKQYKLNKLWEKYRAAKTSDKQRSIFKAIEKLKAEIKKDMDALKIKMLGDKE